MNKTANRSPARFGRRGPEVLRVLYLDCFSGISGDMFLGMSIDLGVSLAHLKRELGKLHLEGYRLASKRAQRGGLWGKRVEVQLTRPGGKSSSTARSKAGFHGHRPSHSHSHRSPEPARGIREIRRIVKSSDLSVPVKQRALSVFQALVAAESKIHGVPPERVHLHETGAVDAIVDIVGASICLEALGVDRVIASPLPLGSGTVQCEHGLFPVPAPATVELLKGIPVYGGELTGELVTPTGAALVATLADEIGPFPFLRVDRVGHGAGSRDPEHHPNLLRGFLGELTEPPALLEKVTVIETTIDDMNPQIYGYLMEKLFEAGALEVFYAPIQMKKNRPGTLATIIVPNQKIDSVSAVIFRETTTIGFRYQRMDRIELGREIQKVRTRYGPIRIKVSLFQGKVVQATPEYEDCRKAAAKAGQPLRMVQRAASEAYHGKSPSQS